ncbi:hypothetical protein [Klebsiella phage SAKp15]|nr:hypothetical protein [Klebsiella phage SAKp02]
MSNLNTTVPAVRLTVESVEGNIGGYLSLEFLRTVNVVFDEMLSRLYHGAKKRKGWATAEPWKELTEHECRTCIRDSLAKGKLIDAMNYLMFAHLNGHKLLSLRNPSTDEPVSIDSQMRDQLANALGVTGRSWDEMLAMVGAVKAQVVEQTEAFDQIAAALQMGPDTPPKHLANIVDSQISRRNTVTEVRITGGTARDAMENIAKAIKANTQSAAFAWDGRKVGTSPTMAAPYGVTTAYDKAAEDCQGVVYEKFAPELRPSTMDTNDDLDLTMVADDSGFRSTLFRFKNEKDRDDYLPLLRTFLGALEQAAYGKGRERHANDLPFIEQPILTMAHMLDSDAGLAQQVIKKTVEARSLPTKQARINELRGTLVYAAAMILFEEMYGKPDAKPSSTSRSVVRVKISDLQPGMVIRFDRDYIAVVEGLIGTQIGDDGKINFWWSVRRERGGVPRKGVVFGSDITFNVDNDPDMLDGDYI